MSNTQRIRFSQETWRKGDRGLLAPHTTDRPAIRNMRMYADGLLGPRPLWSSPIYTLDPATNPPNVSTIIRPAEYRSQTTLYSGYLSVEGSYVRFYTRSNILFAEASITTQVLSEASVFRISDTRWLVGDCNIYLAQDTVTGATGTITVNRASVDIRNRFGITTWLPKGSMIHQGRAFYWGGAFDGSGVQLPSNRVYYSNSIITDGYDGYHTITSAEQFFDVDGEVEGCVSVGPNLMIWTREGRWFIMQGSGDPGNATFNYLGRAKIPGDGRWPQIIDTNAVFLSSDGMSLVTINAGGAINDVTLGYLGFTKTANAYGTEAPTNITVSSLHNATLIPDTEGDGARHNWQGVWTDETWDIETYGNGEFQIGTDEIYGTEMLAIYTPSVGSDWIIRERPITNEEPSRTTAGDFSEYSESYANSPGRLVLPRIYDPARQIRIKRVIIDAVTWSSTGTDYPAAALTASVSDGKNNTTELVLGPGSDPLGTVPDTPRHPIRLVATGTPTAYTHFAEVTLSDIQGLAIEAVTIEYETSEGPIQ